MAGKTTRTVPERGGTRLDEAIALARAILASLDARGSAGTALRQCERLATLLDDDFMVAYAAMALQPQMDTRRRDEALQKLHSGRDARSSGRFRYFQDFQVGGNPIGQQLAGTRISISLLQYSLPEAETFATSARKTLKYTTYQANFRESVEHAEAVVERVRNRMYRWASSTLSRLLFEKVPEKVLDETRKKVDEFLAAQCPDALEKFSVAYEELIGQSAENWTNACTAVRRILLDVADALFPPQSTPIDGRKLGPDEYKNRLWAYTKLKIASESRQKTVMAELDDLGNRIDAIYAQSNKGVHAVVARDEAERVIVRAYLLIADLI